MSSKPKPLHFFWSSIKRAISKPPQKSLTIYNAVLDVVITLAVGAVQYSYLMVLMMYSFGFWPCGSDYLDTWKDIIAGFLVSLLVLGFQLHLTLKVYYLRTTIFKFSSWTITLISLSLIFILGKETLSYSDYYAEFDAMKWKTAEEKPLSMIRVFYEDQRFIGKTREEVIAMLGEGFESWIIDENEIGYRTEGYASPLIFRFENDTVIHYELGCYD